MEMQIQIMGLGANIPSTDIGINVVSGVYISFRREKSQTPITYGISDYLNLGGGQRQLVFGWVKTEWFRVHPRKHPWVNDLIKLKGKTGDIEISGTLGNKGRVTVGFSVIDEHGDMEKLVDKVHIPATGFQAAESKIRGQLRLMPRKTP